MFEKYNEKARRALFFARYEANKLGHRVIESEHILLGILREGEETIRILMERFAVQPEQLRREIEGERVFVERVSSTAELPLSEETKKILGWAAHEAKSMVHDKVGSAHLLIGILRVEGCAAMQILLQAGLELGAVRDEVVAIVQDLKAAAEDELQESEPRLNIGNIALIWDPEAIDSELYAELVQALGNVARASGGKGIARVQTEYVNVRVGAGVLI